MGLTHLDAAGRARMVDVGAKASTERVATASGRIVMAARTRALILAGGLPKGDVVAVARIAGIQAAKQTAALIPLCHPLALNRVDVAIDAEDLEDAPAVDPAVEPASDAASNAASDAARDSAMDRAFDPAIDVGAGPAVALRVRATVAARGPTGVEMEALTAVSVALLTIYDMAKGVERGMVLGDIALEAKSGGRGGPWLRRPPGDGVRRWLADDGGLLWPVVRPFDAAAVDPSAPGLWRYSAALDLPAGAAALTLGEGATPLVAAELYGGSPVHLKLDFLQPTGSYKDRGFAALFAALRHAGVSAVVEDSSGNAGASAAAYGAAAGIAVTLCLPGDAPLGVRVAQAAAHGAVIDRTAPTRADAARRARALAEAGAVYASHVYHPAYLAGLQTIAFELWEQLGRAPDDIVVPLGHGGLLLGLDLGFQALLAGGCIERSPRLHGVQAAARAPIAAAFDAGAAHIAAAGSQPPGAPSASSAPRTIASGIDIADPPRGNAVLAAVRRSGGTVRAVDESAIRTGQTELAARGWFVEPTSAVVAAVAAALARTGGPGGCVVAVLTGSGLKSDPARVGNG